MKKVKIDPIKWAKALVEVQGWSAAVAIAEAGRKAQADTFYGRAHYYLIKNKPTDPTT